MSEITELLDRDGSAPPDLAAVFDRLYDQLKRIAIARMAAQAPGQTLSATGLVHEAYLKLAGAERLSLENRRHFFTCAAKAMRQILIDRERGARTGKRGAGLERITLADFEDAAQPPDLIDLDQALDDLERIDPALRELVELRYFGGLSLEQVGELRGLSLRTMGREWQRARTLLRLRLEADGRG